MTGAFWRVACVGLILGSMPFAASAECLGTGCYDGLGMVIGMLFAAAFIVLALAITLTVLIVRRNWRAAKIVGAVLGLCVVVALALLV